MNKHEGFHTEDDTPPTEHKEEYQLYFDDVKPRRYYLAVNGSGAEPITTIELENKRWFRTWHLNQGYKAPKFGSQKEFDEWIDVLKDREIKRQEPLPFLRTDVEHIENLAAYFGIHIPNMFRAAGQQFLDGKIGDYVRVRLDIGRIYFKWQSLKMFCLRSLSFRDKETEALKMFITKKGDYQGEQGAREWFRWTYWVPWDLFDEATREKWMDVKREEGCGRE
jgi:hypothetical protein